MNKIGNDQNRKRPKYKMTKIENNQNIENYQNRFSTNKKVFLQKNCLATERFLSKKNMLPKSQSRVISILI